MLKIMKTVAGTISMVISITILIASSILLAKITTTDTISITMPQRFQSEINEMEKVAGKAGTSQKFENEKMPGLSVFQTTTTLPYENWGKLAHGEKKEIMGEFRKTAKPSTTSSTPTKLSGFWDTVGNFGRRKRRQTSGESIPSPYMINDILYENKAFTILTTSAITLAVVQVLIAVVSFLPSCQVSRQFFGIWTFLCFVEIVPLIYIFGASFYYAGYIKVFFKPEFFSFISFIGIDALLLSLFTFLVLSFGVGDTSNPTT